MKRKNQESQLKDLENIKNILQKDCQRSTTIIYNKYHTMVSDHIKTFKQYDHDVAAFLATDVILKVLKNLPKYDSLKSNFNTWVMRIASNHLIDYYRKHNKTRSITISYCNNDDNDAQEAFDVISGDSHVDDYILTDEINHIYGQCDPMEKNMLKMKYIEGYNNTEISRKHSIKASAVNNKIKKIKERVHA